MSDDDQKLDRCYRIPREFPEIRKFLPVGNNELKKWIRTGLLPSIKLSERRRIVRHSEIYKLQQRLFEPDPEE
jgi:hypothetical protein